MDLMYPPNIFVTNLCWNPNPQCDSIRASQVALVIKSACKCRRCKRCRFDTGVRKIPWSRKWQNTPVFFSGKFQGKRSLVGYSPQGCKELDTAEHTHAQLGYQGLEFL